MTEPTPEPHAGSGGRERLLAAGVRMFAAKGYAATTVRDLVRAAGVTAPALYHHFDSKEGLFLAILRAGQARTEAARREALAGGGTAAERILRLCRAYTNLRREFAEFAWAVEQIVAGPPATAPRFDFRALAREKVRQFEELVEQGVASGEFRACAPRPVALALVGALVIAARSHLLDVSAGQADADLEGMLAVILSGIAPARSRAPR